MSWLAGVVDTFVNVDTDVTDAAESDRAKAVVVTIVIYTDSVGLAYFVDIKVNALVNVNAADAIVVFVNVVAYFALTAV